MTIIKTIQVESQSGELQETVIIDNGDGSFTSMLKSTYEAKQGLQTYDLRAPAILESTQPDEADLTEGNN